MLQGRFELNRKGDKTMKECNTYKSAGFHNQLINFEKISQDLATDKILRKPINKDGTEHAHKHRSNIIGQHQQQQQLKQHQDHRNNDDNNKIQSQTDSEIRNSPEQSVISIAKTTKETGF